MSHGAQIIRKKKEKSAAILISIIVVFLLCHIHRLAFRLYEMALPETSLYEHYMFCDKKGRYHVPVAIYFLTHMHYLFLAINSSVNFIIYCGMGQIFRAQLWLLYIRIKCWWLQIKVLYIFVQIYNCLLEYSFGRTVWLTYPFDSGFCNFAMKKGALKAVLVIEGWENNLTFFS